jgi:hypothetical protein
MRNDPTDDALMMARMTAMMTRTMTMTTTMAMTMMHTTHGMISADDNDNDGCRTRKSDE